MKSHEEDSMFAVSSVWSSFRWDLIKDIASLSLEPANHTQSGEAATVSGWDMRQAETQQAQEVPEKTQQVNKPATDAEKTAASS